MSSKAKPKALPAKEIRWVSGVVDGVERYVITSNPERTKYYLWEKVDDGFIKIATSKTPIEFEKIMFKRE